MNAPSRPHLVLFAYGFRPFFLLAGVYAMFAVAAWLWMFRQGYAPMQALAAQFWHGHEMLFGFVPAAIAGFMLTAVPSWTGQRGFAGKPLVLLTLLWVAGRAALLLGDRLPWGVIAGAELLFLPALILMVSPSLIRTANRNRPLLFVLLGIWVCDALFLYGTSRNDAGLVAASMRAALDLVLVLITVIGGRIVPAFTGNALRAAGHPVVMRSNTVIERTLVPMMLIYAAADTLHPFGGVTASIAALAGVAHLWRLSGWHGIRTGAQPIVWVLHVAYLWLPLGLLLKAVYVGFGVSWAAFWQHALGAGAATMMIMAVMTRASLGHTGRRLEAARPIVVAYALLALAVLTRVFGPVVLPFTYAHIVMTAGVLWLVAFALFVAVYAPVLLTPRVDGKVG